MDAPRPLISVVIPCYNQAEFLADAIESAVSDTFPVEIVVVDDGSTDDTHVVAARYAGVRCVRQGNRGLAAARNRGLEAATGDFVIFLDADDRLLPGGIDAGARALGSHPECAMAFGRCVMMGRDGMMWPTPTPPVVAAHHHAALLRTNLIWMPAMAILRRDAVIGAGGFAPGFDAAADYDLYLRLARDHSLLDHGHLVAAYRRHSGCMSRNANRMLRETLAVMRRNRLYAAKARLLADWNAGYARWQDFYGTQLVEEIRAHLRQRELAGMLRKGSALARYAPGVLVREAIKKARIVYTGRAIPAAETGAGSGRAPGPSRRTRRRACHNASGPASEPAISVTMRDSG